MSNKVEARRDGAMVIIRVSGRELFCRGEDGEWWSAEPGWELHDIPLFDPIDKRTWPGIEFVHEIDGRFDHVFFEGDDGEPCMCAIIATRQVGTA
jgi:hypothetical protein